LCQPPPCGGFWSTYRGIFSTPPVFLPSSHGVPHEGTLSIDGCQDVLHPIFDGLFQF
jgi:hypothetical protein